MKFMNRKQRESLPWRRFGYLILIIIKFREVLLWFSLRIINALGSYIKHSKGCFNRSPNTSKLVKTRLRLVFSTHFSLFGYLMKHSSSCLIYYFTSSCAQKYRHQEFQFLLSYAAHLGTESEHQVLNGCHIFVSCTQIIYCYYLVLSSNTFYDKN